MFKVYGKSEKEPQRAQSSQRWVLCFSILSETERSAKLYCWAYPYLRHVNLLRSGQKEQSRFW